MFKELLLFFFSKVFSLDKDFARFKLRIIYRTLLLNIYNIFFFRKKLKNYFYLSGSDKYQNYSSLYDIIQILIKNNYKKKILEIGIGGHDIRYSGGSSLLALKFFFYNAKIFGADIVDKSFLNDNSIKIFKLDQSSKKQLKNLKRKVGNLDLIIDDGSHFGRHQIITFETLFPLLNNHGIYIIEDLNGCFLKSYQGDPYYKNIKKNTVKFFQQLCPSVYSKFLNDKIYNKIKKYKNISLLLFVDNCLIVQVENKKVERIKKKVALMSLPELNKKFNNKKDKSGLINHD